MNTNRIAVLLLIVVSVLCSFSCNKSNPAGTGSGMVQLTTSENPVAVAVGSTRFVIITGGSGGYFVKSNSDSTVVRALISMPRPSVEYSSVSFNGLKLGSAVVTIQDSANTAEVEITVTVSVLAASPMAVILQVERTKRVEIQGGISPYVIDQQPNSSIATAQLSGSGSDFIIRGITQGSTSFTVRDNADSPNTLSIPITVVPKPVFTKAGKISYQSNKGNFETEGFIENDLNQVFSSTSNAGAGGFHFQSSVLKEHTVYVIGYKKKSSGRYDYVGFSIFDVDLSPGTVDFDSSMAVSIHNPMAYGVIGFDIDLNAVNENERTYILHSGSVTFTRLTSTGAVGSFSGNGTRRADNVPVAGDNISVTGGSFDVQILSDETSSLSKNEKLPAIENLMKLIKRRFEQTKKQLEQQKKP